MGAGFGGFRFPIAYMHGRAVKPLSYYRADKEKNYTLLLLILWPYLRVKVTIITQMPHGSSLLKVSVRHTWSTLLGNEEKWCSNGTIWNTVDVKESLWLDIWKSLSLLGQSGSKTGPAVSILGVFSHVKKKAFYISLKDP